MFGLRESHLHQFGHFRNHLLWRAAFGTLRLARLEILEVGFKHPPDTVADPHLRPVAVRDYAHLQIGALVHLGNWG